MYILYAIFFSMAILFTPINAKGSDYMPYGFTQAQWNAMPAGQKEGYVSAEAVKNKPSTGQITAPVTAGYNPQTGIQTFADGTTAQKFTWEADPANPTLLQPENAGTGAVVGTDRINAGNANQSLVPPPVVDPMAEYQKYIKDLADAQRQSRISALDSAKSNALSSLSGEEASIAPNYYDKRNQAAGQSDVSAMNFAQFMAGRGIKGNAGAMPEIYSQAGLNSQVGALNQQEAAANTDIARRKSGIESAYQSDVANATADVQSQSMSALLDQYRMEQQQKIADNAAMGKTSTGATTLAGQTYADQRQKQLEEAYLANVGQFGDNYQAEINKVKNDGDPSNDWQLGPLGNARQQKLQTQAEKAAADAAAKSEADQQAYKNALDMWKASGTATADIAGILGVPVGAETASYDIARLNAQTAQTNANKPAAQPKADSFTLDDWAKTLDAEFLPKYDTYGGIVTPGITDQATREQRILDLNLDPNMTAQLYRKYGIPLPQ